MHRIQNFSGQARHGWERMAPSMGFGTSRNHNELSQPPQSSRRSLNTHQTSSSGPAPGSTVTLSFNVPFNSSLGGPEREEVIYASPGAFARWTFLEGTDEGTPVHMLPVHEQNVENLRLRCRQIEDETDSQVQALVLCAEPKSIPGYQRGPLNALVTNVCLYGEYERVQQYRGKLLTQSPLSLRCATVDIDEGLIIEPGSSGIRSAVLNHLDEVSRHTKADIFLLHPKQIPETASMNGITDTSLEHRLRCYIYGDMESAEHAKMRVLIMIDQILHRKVDVMQLELSMHTLISGRARKQIKRIESITNTAIYFPPPFPHIWGYHPRGAVRRNHDDIIITGHDPASILRAKQELHTLVIKTKALMKEVLVTASKLDSIILERLDKVQKIIETNGSYVLLPPLGHQQGFVRIQGTDVLHVERTVKDVMNLASQFYRASWWITQPDPSQRQPTPADVRTMLSDICINSGAEIAFEGLNFHIDGSDEAVKAALMVISNIPFVKKSAYTMNVKVELANEHKEFVSGKKNGKINKIMGHSNVQIVFDGFNEYNFYIDVRGSQYEATKNGLDLVEAEMPASISFHVPDQYHKRIIGIGGQHIQRIMKKYSVFVKFSNAMDRGSANSKEEDDYKVENVICRTPARNAQNLELVKAEIMDMVEKADAEFVSENVVVDRLYHRELIAQMTKIEELERKWNCKIIFPSTEQASDVVTVTGPEYQVPLAVDEFLKMVPQLHELAFPAPSDLKEYLSSASFVSDVAEKMKEQFEVEVSLKSQESSPPATSKPNEDTEATKSPQQSEMLVLSYTRNNAGGLKDVIDFLVAKLVPHGLDASTVTGTIPRPKSDSFEDTLPFFENKLLQSTNKGTDSPTRSGFGEGESSEQQGSFFSKFRKPGSMSSFSSLIDRNRKNGSNSPGSLFKHASSNASKASLASMASLESQGSGYRNPWNDSGINLPEEDQHSFSQQSSGFTSSLTPTSTSTIPWPAPSAAATARFEGKPFPGLTAMTSGDVTPTSRHDPRASVTSFDSGRPSTSHSLNNSIGVGLSAPPSTIVGNGSAHAATTGPGPIAPPSR